MGIAYLEPGRRQRVLPPPIPAGEAGRVGEVLRGRWRLDQRLGSGTMGEVYAATHRNGRRAAIKLMHGRLARDRVLRERFVQEAYFANCVHHPHAVQVLDDDVTQDGCPFLIMELCQGTTLAALRAEHGGRLPESAVVTVLDGLLDVLSAVHAAGVVHRDIEPGNVLVTDAGVVKLVDFGCAMRRRGTQVEDVAPTSVVGTAGFRAPEQASGVQRTDARSDLWSVAALGYSLLSGPGTWLEPSEPTIAPRVSAHLGDVLDRAFASDPEARWPDAATMRRALHTKIEDEITPPPETGWHASPYATSPRLVAAGAAAAAMLSAKVVAGFVLAYLAQGLCPEASAMLDSVELQPSRAVAMHVVPAR